jgi:hypothetical protein
MHRISLGSTLYFEAGSWSEAVVETLVGGYTGLFRGLYVLASWLYQNLARPVMGIFGVELPTGRREKVSNGTIHVAAVGYGRTGTYSLMVALEDLGFPTLHTIHMYAIENEEILQMWTDRMVEPALKERKPLLGKADLKLIADLGYTAVADLPLCLFYEQIYNEYPNAKFILMTRENSEVWFRSWETLTTSISTFIYIGGLVFPTLKQYSNYLRWLHSYVNKDISYMDGIIPSSNNIKENAITSYEEHNRRVREIIPAEQLLEYNVKQGWEPLCQFLEIENCPKDKPFPKTNSARSMKAQSNTAFYAVAIVVIYLIRKMMTRSKQPAKDSSKKDKTQ